MGGLCSRAATLETLEAQVSEAQSRSTRKPKPGKSSVVYEACTSGDTVKLRQALDAGESPDSIGPYGQTALFTACHWGFVECVKQIIEAGANVDACGASKNYAVIAAAKHKKPACVKELIKANASLDVQDDSGCTALMYACSEGHRETVFCLLEAGAEWDIKNKAKENVIDCVKKSKDQNLINDVSTWIDKADADRTYAREAMHILRTF